MSEPDLVLHMYRDRVRDDGVWKGDAFRSGVELWNRGEFWEAHEAWEGPWRAAGRTSAAGQVLQGLILLAAAGVKHEAGAHASARRLATRGAKRLRGAGVSALPFDALAFAASVEAWADGARATPPPLVLVEP